jgi:hypothetical protein
LEKLARDKHSNLLRTFVNHSSKSFKTLGPGLNVETFYIHELQLFVIC